MDQNGENTPSTTDTSATSATPSTTGEGGQSVYIKDVTHEGITPNPEANTHQQDQDAALYQQLRIIPTNKQVSETQTETQCAYAGLAALRQAHATVDQVANYLMQLYGYCASEAVDTARSVLETGTVFRFPLPTVPAAGWDFAVATPDVQIPRFDQPAAQTTT